MEPKVWFHTFGIIYSQLGPEMMAKEKLISDYAVCAAGISFSPFVKVPPLFPLFLCAPLFLVTLFFIIHYGYRVDDSGLAVGFL